MADAKTESELERIEARIRFLASKDAAGISNNPMNPIMDSMAINAKKAAERAATDYVNKNPEKYKTEEEKKNAIANIVKNGEDVEIDGKKVRLKSQQETYKADFETFVENTKRGYNKKEPIKFNSIFEGAVGGATEKVKNFEISGILGGITGGLFGGIKNFILELPYVGTFLSQLGHWASSQIGALFGGKEKPLSWDEAGRMASAEKAGRHIKAGLSTTVQIAGGQQNVDALVADLEHTLTYQVKDPEGKREMYVPPSIIEGAVKPPSTTDQNGNDPTTGPPPSTPTTKPTVDPNKKPDGPAK